MSKIDKIRVAMEIAQSVSQLSHDSETQVGSVLINKTNKAMIATGYNGFVAGAPDDELPTTRPDKYKYMVHSEANLIANCAKNGINTNDCYVVCTMSPCITCSRLLFQCGIRKIFCKNLYTDFDSICEMKDMVITKTKYYYIDREDEWCWEITYDGVNKSHHSRSES